MQTQQHDQEYGRSDVRLREVLHGVVQGLPIWDVEQNTCGGVDVSWIQLVLVVGGMVMLVWCWVQIADIQKTPFWSHLPVLHTFDRGRRLYLQTVAPLFGLATSYYLWPLGYSKYSKLNFRSDPRRFSVRTYHYYNDLVASSEKESTPTLQQRALTILCRLLQENYIPSDRILYSLQPDRADCVLRAHTVSPVITFKRSRPASQAEAQPMEWTEFPHLSKIEESMYSLYCGVSVSIPFHVRVSSAAQDKNVYPKVVLVSWWNHTNSASMTRSIQRKTTAQRLTATTAATQDEYQWESKTLFYEHDDNLRRQFPDEDHRVTLYMEDFGGHKDACVVPLVRYETVLWFLPYVLYKDSPTVAAALQPYGLHLREVTKNANLELLQLFYDTRLRGGGGGGGGGSDREAGDWPFDMALYRNMANVVEMVSQGHMHIFFLIEPVSQRLEGMYWYEDAWMTFDEVETSQGGSGGGKTMTLRCSWKSTPLLSHIWYDGFLLSWQALQCKNRDYNVLMMTTLGHNIWVSEGLRRRHAPVVPPVAGYVAALNWVWREMPLAPHRVFLA